MLGGSLSYQDLDFGAMLRAHREHCGITIEMLAVAMKVRASLLEDLERNDLARWPDGIYGRSFIRQYAILVGLAPEGVLQQFGRCFPDRQEPPRLLGTATGGGLDLALGSELRLTLENVASRSLSIVPWRVVDIAGGLILVLAIGGVLALVTGFPFWTTAGVVALIWYPLASAIYGGEVSLHRLFRIDADRSVQLRPADAPLLDLQAARDEQEDVMQTFEGDDPEPEVQPELPLSVSRQVH